MNNNPLLNTFQTPFQVPPFEDIQDEHYLPAIDEAIEANRSEIKDIVERQEVPSFENTIEALELAGGQLDAISSVLFNLNAAETTDELQKITQGASEKLTAFSNEIKQNELLFARIASVHENIGALDLTTEQRMLLEKTYKGFVRSGAALGEEAKKRFKEISLELSKLTLTFGENVLAETNDFKLVVEDERQLSGLPDDVIARAGALGKEEGVEGKWLFTLQAPSYIPFMQYANDRALREEMFRAYMSKANRANDKNNGELVRQIISLRAEMAELLGYETYAEYVLEERMAKRPKEVLSFLDDLLEKSVRTAREEVDELQAFVRESGYDYELQRWDWAYFSEKLKKKKFDFDDEQLKPFFKLEHVIHGVFQTAERLFGITFKENKEIPVYHEDVQAYEVWEGGAMKAVFFADFFPRKGKRPGAWMTSYRDQKKTEAEKILPIVSIVCNFTPSSEEHPSLLKFDEVLTLFHEFGHA
ncbi:MAG: M3 family metallopeptidase, partial [Bacteroidota bacterium]